MFRSLCASRENTEKLCDFFTDTQPETTQAELVCPEDPENPLLAECMTLSRKGIYCFDVNTDKDVPADYILISRPETPLKCNQLPDEIREIISACTIDSSVSETDVLSIPHAY